MYKFLIVSICFNDLSIDRCPYQGVPAVRVNDGMTGLQQVSSPGGWRSEERHTFSLSAQIGICPGTEIAG